MITGEAQKPEDYSKPDFTFSDGYSNSNSRGTTGAVSFEGAYLGSGGGDEGGSAESAGSTGNGPGDPPSKALLIYSTLEKPTDYNSHHHSPFKNRFKKGGFWDFLFNKMLGGPAGMVIPSPMAIIESGAVSVTAIVGEEVAVASSNATKTGTELFNFGGSAARHMAESGRAVPVQILEQAIKGSKGVVDPQGSRALMYTTEMLRNGKAYNLEVLYDKATNTIWHFQYSPIKP